MVSGFSVQVSVFGTQFLTPETARHYKVIYLNANIAYKYIRFTRMIS
jgi:hypothetical protein